MRLWILTRTQGAQGGEWTEKRVVRAENEPEAREIAELGELKGWDCAELTADGARGEIARDYGE